MNGLLMKPHTAVSYLLNMVLGHACTDTHTHTHSHACVGGVVMITLKPHRTVHRTDSNLTDWLVMLFTE